VDPSPASEFDETTGAVEGSAGDPRLLDELAEAGTQLEKGASDARALGAVALAESIAAVGLQTNDLIRMQVRRLRIAAKMTQVELARRVGTRQKFISDLETGKQVIPTEFMHQVSAVFGIPPIALTAPLIPSVIQLAQTAVAGEETRAFEVVATGISMEPSIRHGDRLLVSHDIELAAGRIVVAIHNGAWIVKRLAIRDVDLVLRSDNANEEVEVANVQIQGIVVELNRTV
jgi:SOS-response transcriptional repressor LexA